MPTPYHDVLDAGDRLAAALDAGDLDQAATTLDERAALVEALAAATGPPPRELVDRFQQQDARLRTALQGGLRSLADEIASTARTATAASAYARPAARSSLDTARR